MATIEETIDDGSLKIIEKVLLSEIIKLKREIKEIPLYHRNYHTNFNDCERARNPVIEAMEDYGLIK